jgi:lipopolysaccharide exporter
VKRRSGTPRLSRSLPTWTRAWLADSFVLGASQTLTIVATSAAAILIARHLDPSDWGVFGGFFALSVAMTIVIQFGMSAWLLRELSKLFADDEPDAAAEATRLVGAALTVNFALTAPIVAGGLVVAHARGLDGEVTVALASLLAYAGLSSASIVIETDLRARRRVARVAAASILEKYVLVGLVVSIAMLGGGLAMIGLSYVAAGVVRLLFVCVSVLPGRPNALEMPTRHLVVRVLRDSLPFALASSCVNVVPKLDTFVLLAFSATSAGYFALGDRVLGPALVFQDVLSATLFPFFAKALEHRAPWLLAALFAAVGACGGLALFVFAPALVPVVFGDKYEEAVPVVRIFALALPLVFAAGPLRVYAFSRQRERRVVVLVFVASVAGTIGIVTGQWAFGVVAAAVAWLMRQVLFLAAMAIECANVDRSRTAAQPLDPAASVEGRMMDALTP